MGPGGTADLAGVTSMPWAALTRPRVLAGWDSAAVASGEPCELGLADRAFADGAAGLHPVPDPRQFVHCEADLRYRPGVVSSAGSSWGSGVAGYPP